MRRNWVALTAAAIALATPATAQVENELRSIAVPVAGPTDCGDGVKHDDGSFETGYGTFSVFGAEYVMRVVPPAGGQLLENVCVCWLRDETDTVLAYDVVVWAADGPGGAPGTRLGKFGPFQASAVSNSTPKFYRSELAGHGLVVNGPVYIGAFWDSGDDSGFFVCADENGSGGQPAYVDTSLDAGDSVAPDTRLGQTGTFPFYKSIGVRAVFSPSSTAGCSADADTLCLNNGRFKVETTFNTGSQSGNAQVVKLTDETGYLWFFSASNVEVVIKILNACALNSRYWVFTAGLTNVNVIISVTDTQTGTVKTYTNPPNTKYVAVQDTSAFATCP